MRVLITRAREDAEPLAEMLEEIGVETIIDPLLDIVFLPGPPLDLAGVQGLLITSANGVRAFCQRSDSRALPVYAVGDASAHEASKHGFQTVLSASGDVDALAALVGREAITSKGALLHVAGTAMAGDLAGLLTAMGYTCRREVLYEAKTATCLSEQTVDGFQSGRIDGVLLYSPRTAQIFVDLVRQQLPDLLMTRIIAYCLSANVKAKASQITWKRCRVADMPEQEALVALLAADN